MSKTNYQQYANNETIAGRIATILVESDCTPATFSRRIGWSASYLFEVITKGKVPGADKLASLSAAYPDYDLNWIVANRGNKRTDVRCNPDEHTEVRNELERCKAVVKYLEDRLQATDSGLTGRVDRLEQKLDDLKTKNQSRPRMGALQPDTSTDSAR